MAVVETARLILRPFNEGDVPAYTAIRAKPQVVRFLAGGASGANDAKQRAASRVTAFAALWNSPGGYGPWAVEEKVSGRLIGHCGLRVWDALGGATEVLYMLDDTVWGRGYATESAAASLAFGFDTLRLEEIVAVALPENEASLRVMEKIGMQRQPGLHPVAGVQAVRYAMRRTEYRGSGSN
jgi:[ribosomal protein S5]-alanine N-acetyltransferase